LDQPIGLGPTDPVTPVDVPRPNPSSLPHALATRSRRHRRRFSLAVSGGLRRRDRVRMNRLSTVHPSVHVDMRFVDVSARPQLLCNASRTDPRRFATPWRSWRYGAAVSPAWWCWALWSGLAWHRRAPRRVLPWPPWLRSPTVSPVSAPPHLSHLFFLFF
jgi:hypothetical protein